MKHLSSLFILSMLMGCASIPSEDQTRHPVVVTGSSDHRDFVYDSIEQSASILHEQHDSIVEEPPEPET